LNTGNCIITNHLAQNFPNLHYRNYKKGEDTRVKFDRICCDVPCSSDAAIRKIPQKWATWNTKDSQALHPLQLTILRKAVEMLKVGGKMTYSTCSLNPIENESVVAAALKEFEGKIRLVKAELPGFRHQPGMTSWQFLNSESKGKPEGQDSFFKQYQHHQEIPEPMQQYIKETMFCSNYSPEILAELQKCVRVMPHHQNTSGFFITVIEKIAELDSDLPQIAQTDASESVEDMVIQNDPKKRDFNFFRCDSNDPDVQYIKAYYGLSSMPSAQMVTQDPATMNRVYYVNSELSRFLQADTKAHELNIISLGTTIFQRNKSTGQSAGVECIFRTNQDGVGMLISEMKNRIVKTDSAIDFKRLIMRKYHEIKTDFKCQ